jgi:hypothetical protein
MHSLYLSLVVCVVTAISVIGHPSVHPSIRAANSETNEFNDLYAQFPNERPLHTTVLMAQHAHATAAPGRGGNEELK